LRNGTGPPPLPPPYGTGPPPLPPPAGVSATAERLATGRKHNTPSDFLFIDFY
jgi:hypothetical protein